MRTAAARRSGEPLAEGATDEAPPAARSDRGPRLRVRRALGVASRPIYASPAPPPPAAVWYHGQHFVPDELGGGWCYAEGPHQHDYAPDRVDAADLHEGYYYYRGAYEFRTTEAIRCRPAAGATCGAAHVPPDGPDFAWNRGRGWIYRGAWRPHRPPPPSYWPVVRAPRPTPRPADYARPYPDPATATSAPRPPATSARSRRRPPRPYSVAEPPRPQRRRPRPRQPSARPRRHASRPRRSVPCALPVAGPSRPRRRAPLQTFHARPRRHASRPRRTGPRALPVAEPPWPGR